MGYEGDHRPDGVWAHFQSDEIEAVYLPTVHLSARTLWRWMENIEEMNNFWNEVLYSIVPVGHIPRCGSPLLDECLVGLNPKIMILTYDLDLEDRVAEAVWDVNDPDRIFPVGRCLLCGE